MFERVKNKLTTTLYCNYIIEFAALVVCCMV